MDAQRLESIRADYDRIADEYAAHIAGELANKPLDRQLLLRFAAATGARGLVCDMGCGPGHVACFLHNAGVEVFGLDLAPQMVEQAGRLNPGIAFRQGNMLALDLPDASLAGITAFYSIVNLPVESVSAAFREMARVLAPGGLLLLAFHAGDEVLNPSEFWGRPVSMEFFYFRPPAIRQLLADAGFAIEELVERGPYAPEVEHQSHRAYIFARKPSET
ncbi:MAG: class I SAM-dependent methyltransferase [Terracidiphilus sp.]